MTFVVFHGAYGSPDSNWFPELKEKLEALGQKVVIPQFPVDDWPETTETNFIKTAKKQNLSSWLKEFGKVQKQFGNEKLCFIGHSLGPLFILHAVEKYKITLDSAIFVSPFLTKLNDWKFDIVNESFYKEDFDFEKLKKLIPVSYTLYSNNDPYVDSSHSIMFAKNLNSSLVVVKDAGHMNAEVNLNEFPLVLELCKTRIDLPLYQKYLAHRRELYSIDYIKGKNEEVVYLKPEEVYDEGVFHFRNLQKKGFCTFYTRFNKFWNTQSKYFEEARRAVKRVKNFTRVFMVDKISDLKNPTLIDQVERDLKAGIKIYLCMYNAVEKTVPEPDFGIWDDDYYCIVRPDDEIRLSSLKKEIAEANKWSEEILKKSIQIHSLEDLQKFVSKQS